MGTENLPRQDRLALRSTAESILADCAQGCANNLLLKAATCHFFDYQRRWSEFS